MASARTHIRVGRFLSLASVFSTIAGASVLIFGVCAFPSPSPPLALWEVSEYKRMQQESVLEDSCLHTYRYKLLLTLVVLNVIATSKGVMGYGI